jgi:ABC-type Fe3+/spermidine/putrescine transport system ATPase subunit
MLTGSKLAAYRSRIGMVFQHFELFPHMTALQNVMEGPVTVKGDPRHVVGISYPVMFSDERDEPLGLCSERALTRRCDLPLIRRR